MLSTLSTSNHPIKTTSLSPCLDHLMANPTPNSSSSAQKQRTEYIEYLSISQTQANVLFLTTVQQQLFHIQSQFTNLDILSFREYHIHSKNLPVQTPPTDLCRKEGTISVLSWERLQRTLAHISVYFVHKQTEDQLGEKKALKAIHWIKHILRNPGIDRYIKPRDLISSKYLTAICAEAIVAQNVKILPNFRAEWELICEGPLLGRADTNTIINHPHQFHEELALSYLSSIRYLFGR